MSEETKEVNKAIMAPHLALTHVSQGGAANGRNVALLLKSETNFDSKEVASTLEKILEKASGDGGFEQASYNAKKYVLDYHLSRKMLREYGGFTETYLQDFDEESLVFYLHVYDYSGEYDYKQSGLYYCGYKVKEVGDDVEAEFSEIKRAVTVYSYVPETDKLKVELSKELPKDGVGELLLKSKDNINNNRKIVDFYKSLYLEEKENMSEVTELKQQLEGKDQEVTVLKSELEAVKVELETLLKSVKEAEQNKRLELIKSVKKDEAEALELLKSLEGVSDESFGVVMKSLQKEADKLEESDMFKSVSQGNSTAEPENALAELLKAKYQQQ